MYTPSPIDTSRIEVPKELNNLIERLAENNHETWAKQRIEEGWVYGSTRNDEKKQHPDLIPYDELPDNEKEYDRITARETIKAIISLGFSFRRKNEKDKGSTR